MEFEFGNIAGEEGYVPEEIGRLKLGNGDTVRIYFSHKGVGLFIPRSAIKEGYVVIDEDVEQITGIGD